MKSGEIYTRNQIDKLGNALIFLCQKLQAVGEPVSKTHLLKLIFIVEEIAIKKFGIPFFDLRFDVWKLGPVSKDLFVELSGDGGTDLLSSYITKEIVNGSVFIKAKKDFSDDEFNDKEIELLNEISHRFLYCTAKELINFTHRKDSIWYKTALKHGVLDLLESGQMTTTDIEIPLEEIIQDEKEKLALYKNHKEFMKFSRSLKS
jgi:uncharacterized phage-associated protein